MATRNTTPLVLRAAERAELERVMLDPRSSHGAALRSTAMLMAAEPGMTTPEVAERLGVSGPAVRKWRNSLADIGVAELTSPRAKSDAKAGRYHPWAGDPRNRIAVILRAQAELLQRSCLSLQKDMAEKLWGSSEYLRRASAAAGRADYTAAVGIGRAARHTPHTARTAWAVAAQRAASGAVTPVKQAALIDAAVCRIRLPIGDKGESVSPIEFSILHTLARLGPMRSSQLAKAEQIGSIATAVRVPALEKRGYLTRTADPSSPDLLLLTATERTHALIRRLAGRH